MDFSYNIVRSNRRTIAIYIKNNGEVKVKAPKRVSEKSIQDFVEKKENWILKHLSRIKDNGNCDLQKFTKKEIQELKNKAKQYLPIRVEQLSKVVKVDFNRVFIKSQKTLWGSCSIKRNINLNFLLVLLPNDICDYVIVHELCHIIEMNHSNRFWKLVEKYIPDYREKRKWLRTNGQKYFYKIS